MNFHVCLMTMVASWTFALHIVQAGQSVKNQTSEISFYDDPHVLTEKVVPLMLEMWSQVISYLNSTASESTANSLISQRRAAIRRKPPSANLLDWRPSVGRRRRDAVETRTDLNDFRSLFGQRINYFGKKQPTPSERERKAYRVHYTETFFKPLTFMSHMAENYRSAPHIQLWSPVSNFEVYDSFQERSLVPGVQDIPDTLAAAALVSIDKRVIDVIEEFPLNCSQIVLCRIGSALVEASPLQALLLYSFKNNVFGYRDAASNEAILAALEGDNCERLFEACPNGLA